MTCKRLFIFLLMTSAFTCFATVIRSNGQIAEESHQLIPITLKVGKKMFDPRLIGFSIEEKNIDVSSISCDVNSECVLILSDRDTQDGTMQIGLAPGTGLRYIVHELPAQKVRVISRIEIETQKVRLPEIYFNGLVAAKEHYWTELRYYIGESEKPKSFFYSVNKKSWPKSIRKYLRKEPPVLRTSYEMGETFKK